MGASTPCSVNNTQKEVSKRQTSTAEMTLPREASSKPVLVSPVVPWVLELAGREASSDSGLVTNAEAGAEAAASAGSSASPPQPTRSCSVSAARSSSSSPLSPSMASTPQWLSTPSNTSAGMEWDKGKGNKSSQRDKGEGGKGEG